MDIKNRALSFLVFILVVLSTISQSHAEGLFDDYLFRVGVGIRNIDLQVTSVFEKNPSGTMTEGEYVAPTFSMNSPYSYFKQSNFGYYFEYGIYNFDMNRQVVEGGTAEDNQGTSVDGFSAYFAPVLFYNIGNKLELKNRHSFIIGVGLGIGYLDASGDVIFTETTKETFNVDIDKVDIAIAVLLEYQYGPWFVRIQDVGPSIREGDYDYELLDQSFTIGYSFKL